MEISKTMVKWTVAVFCIFSFLNSALSAELQPVQLNWQMSDLIKNCDGPTDALGHWWYEFDFDDSAWQAVTLPHSIKNSSAVDRFYRGFFTLDFVPAVAEISFKSDDGLWIYANGVFIGHWGGNCYRPSCVNLSPCGTEVWVKPQQISRYLQKGTNLITVHVTNWAGPAGMTFNLSLKAGGVLIGDVNGDGTINVADPIYLLDYLFASGSPPVTDESAEVNCDERVNIADAVYLIYYLFAQGPAPGCQ